MTAPAQAEALALTALLLEIAPPEMTVTQIRAMARTLTLRLPPSAATLENARLREDIPIVYAALLDAVKWMEGESFPTDPQEEALHVLRMMMTDANRLALNLNAELPGK